MLRKFSRTPWLLQATRPKFLRRFSPEVIAAECFWGGCSQVFLGAHLVNNASSVPCLFRILSSSVLGRLLTRLLSISCMVGVRSSSACCLIVVCLVYDDWVPKVFGTKCVLKE